MKREKANCGRSGSGFLRSSLVLLAWFLCVPMSPNPLLGANYFVAPGGDDNNPGSVSEPWRTLQKAANTVGPGSTVYVRTGVYNEKVNVNVSGSEDGGYVTFQNYGTEAPVVDGTGLMVPPEDNGLFLIQDRNYIVIQGFELRNYQTSTQGCTPVGVNILGTSHHIRLKNNRIHHIETHAPLDPDGNGADAHGIAVFGTSAPDPVHHIIIEGNELYSLTLGSSEALVLNGNVENFTIENNTIHDVNNIAVDCIGFEGTASDPYDQARNGVIRGNRIYNVSSYGNPSYGNDYCAGGIYVDGGRDIVVERNMISGADIGVEIASEHKGRATRNVTVRNNVISDSPKTGISLGGYDKNRGSTESCTIVNNTLYNNDTQQEGCGEILLQFDTRDNVIKNNIFFSNAQGLLIGNPYTENTGNVVDSNLYFTPEGALYSEWEWKKATYQGFESYRTSTGNDVHSLFADPMFSGLSPFDFHLRAESPARNAGQNLAAAGEQDMDRQPRVLCGTIDMGADEVPAGLAPLLLLLWE